LSWYRQTPRGWEIAIHAQPGARQSRVVGLHGRALKIQLQAPPIEGKANEALIRFLAHALGVPQRAVTLIAGERSRAKRVAIHVVGADPSVLLPLQAPARQK
jgi:uncharacterized protein